MERCNILEEVIILPLELPDIEFCPKYSTIWNSSPNDFKKQYAFGVCELYNTLVACAVYPTYKNECDMSMCMQYK